MKTIVIMNQKGGSGKSTVTVHLAATAQECGDGPVVISDTDPQATSSYWHDIRRKSGIETPHYAKLRADALSSSIKILDNSGASWLFIDTAPWNEVLNNELLAFADLVLIPLNPTPADLRAAVKGLGSVRQSGKPFRFILNRVRANLRANGRAADALGNLGLLANTHMHERVIYAETFAYGKTALEIEPRGAAAAEMRNLWSDIKTQVQPVPAGSGDWAGR